MEPPERRQVFLDMEAGWTYVEVAPASWTVTMPVADLLEIQKDSAEWRDSSQAHHDAVQWRDDARAGD